MPNRLSNESSPYLKQHADNPVDWYPWGDEALAAAKEQNKPILLSVGYSACHWCHVMENESFSNAQVAAQMNEGFINIKVDREERPDIDDVYMQAVQAFSGGRGGWPMTVFLFPDGRPFFGGTYFPPEPQQGLPSFTQVLSYATHLFDNDRDRADASATQLTQLLAASGAFPDEQEPELSWLDAVAGAADDAYDTANAGFGGAPKFPPHSLLPVLLAHYERTGRARSLGMVVGTLDGMMRGGMYDILGGGFCRYSTDAEWRVPHFEKMLIDNALLVPIYLDAAVRTGSERYNRVARETLDYIARDLALEGGGYAASEDADSGGFEGAYYAWTPEELAGLLGVDDGIQASLLLGLTQHGTFERGTSVLRTDVFPEDLEASKRTLYDEAVAALRLSREDRQRPGRDHKAVTAYNGFALSAFAKGGALLGEERYLSLAADLAHFLLHTATVDGRLMRTVTDGTARIPAFVEDYAAVASGLVDLHQATLDPEWLAQALSVTERMLDLFWDADGGGLFFTGHDTDSLVVRSKRLVGGSEPSGNGLAAWLLARLGALCDRADFTEKAQVLVTGMSALTKRAPRAMGAGALADGWLRGTSQELGLVGPRDAKQAFVNAANAQPSIFRVMAHHDGEVDPNVPWMANQTTEGDQVTAYLCQDHACSAPVRSVDELVNQLKQSGKPQRAARVGGARVRAPALPSDVSDWLNTDTPLSLADLKGRVAVLDFWTLCCINCHHVLPALAQVEDTFADQPVVVVGVHSAKFPAEKERESVERAIARHHIRHPVILDPEHALWSQYAVKSWPSIVVLDTQGRVAWHHAGEVSPEELTSVVGRLVDEGREQGTLASRIDYRIKADREPTRLSFPGKLAVWPTYAGQATGKDPFGPDARLYIADSGNHRILEALWRLGPEGWPEAEVVRSWGTGTAGYQDGEVAQFNNPQGLCRRDDTLYIADTDNHRVRAIDLSTGLVRTIMGSGELGRGDGTINPAEPLTIALRSPWDVSAADDVLFVAMAGAHQIWLHMEEPVRSGPFVGTGAEAHVDGDPAQAALAQPSGLQVHGQYLFWMDSETSSLRLLDMAKRNVGTVFGRDLFDFGDEDGPPAKVLMQHPLGLTVAEATVYVADTYNHKIKAVDMANGAEVTTLAGGEGILCDPSDVDVSGPFLVVADTGNHRLRVMDREEGQVRTVVIQGLSTSAPSE